MRSIVDQINDSLRGRTVVYIGKRALDSFVFPIHYDHVVCIDWGREFQAMLSGMNTWSMEKVIGKRGNWGSPHLAQALGPDGDLAASVAQWGRGTVIIPYQTSLQLEALALVNGWKVTSAPMELKENLHDKRNLSRLLERAELPMIQSRVLHVQELDNYEQLKMEFGTRMVIQIANGSSGDGTYVVTRQEELRTVYEKLKLDNQEMVKVAKFVEGMALNVNACVTKYGTLVAPVSVQAIGIPECSDNLVAYCGNEWMGEKLPRELRRRIYEVVERVGNELKREGCLGYCGVDLLYDEKEDVVYVLELNLRVNGSSQTLTDMQLQRGVIPLGVYHLAEHLGVGYQVDAQLYNETSLDWAPQAYQVVIHNGNQEVETGSGVRPGLYVWDGEDLEFDSDGWRIGHVRNRDHVLVNCGVPGNNLKVDPGAVLFKIQGYGQILNGSSFRLTDSGKYLIERTKSLCFEKATKDQLVEER